MISKLRLSNFRNFKDKTVNFSPGTTVIIGPNGSGKTNVLEGLHLASTGKSFKARIEEEMVNWDEDVARVGVKTGETSLEVVLTRGEMNVGMSVERIPRKKLLVNGVSRRLVDFAGNFRAVLFGPWDLELVTESPSVRRKFLDGVLGQVDREYRRALLSYEKGLRQRNRLLFRIREEGMAGSHLMFWNKLLVKNGDYISQARGELVDYINSTGPLDGQKFSVFYDKSSISEVRLEQYREEEVAAATTLVGPHRDDFIIKSDERGLSRFGSRGEQRMGVLWLKMAELSFIENKIGDKPTLFLDDIFSELDHEHREIALKLSYDQQTVITTTDLENVHEINNIEKVVLEG